MYTKKELAMGTVIRKGNGGAGDSGSQMTFKKITVSTPKEFMEKYNSSTNVSVFALIVDKMVYGGVPEDEYSQEDFEDLCNIAETDGLDYIWHPGNGEIGEYKGGSEGNILAEI